MEAKNSRELEIRLQVPLRPWHWVLFAFLLIMNCAFIWLILDGILHNPLLASTQMAVMVMMTAVAVLRIWHVRSLFLRINDDGCTWRLIAGVDIPQQTRPPISEHMVRWETVRVLRHEASGIRVNPDENTEVFLPLSNFSYAQRQEIKRVVATHVSERGITAHAFTPRGWNDEDAEASVEGVHTDDGDMGDMHRMETTETP